MSSEYQKGQVNITGAYNWYGFHVGSIGFSLSAINKDGQVRIGKCHSTPYVLESGKIELHEEWQWLNGDKSAGTSIISSTCRFRVHSRARNSPSFYLKF